MMGKTYVCSDIHAHADVLREVLAMLGEDDRLYMIGDAVDKGPDGMEALQMLIADPRCEMLLGNHDLMMMQNYECEKHRDEVSILKRDDIFFRWQILNFGNHTWDALMQESEEEQERLMDYLKSRPLLKLLEVNGRKFCLVHAAIPADYPLDDLHDLYLDTIADEKYPFLFDWKSDFVWGRYVTKIPGYTVIVGHTPAQYRGDEFILQDGEDWYDIDCGLAYNEDSSKLALLCLDDMELRYIPIGKKAAFSDRR